ncbi:hypothetical protein TorRG33x02_183320, partial [Trema orientale]
HIVSERGIEVDKAKIELISNLPTPKSVRDVRIFLGKSVTMREDHKCWRCRWPMSDGGNFAGKLNCRREFRTARYRPPELRSQQNWSRIARWRVPFHAGWCAELTAAACHGGEVQQKLAFFSPFKIRPFFNNI